MKMFYVKSSKLPELYVFARDPDDAVIVYASFKRLIDQSEDPFDMKRVDDGPGWKPNRAVRALLKARTRGVGMPFPEEGHWLTEALEWVVWTAP